MSIAAKIIRERAVVYGLWTDQPAGGKSYVIIEVDRPKHEEFQRLLERGGAMNLAAFGTIHYHEWHAPSAALKAEFNEKFGLYPNG